MNKIMKIRALIENDDEPIQKAEHQLLKVYSESDNKEKKAIDNAFIALCGFSLETILKDSDLVSKYELN